MFKCFNKSDELCSILSLLWYILYLNLYIFRISVNFDGLSSEKKSAHGDGIKRMESKLQDELDEMGKKLSSMQGPNMKANQLLEAVKSKAQQHEMEFEKMRKELKQARDAFERVKKERYDRFMACFDKISQNIDGIYKVRFKKTNISQEKYKIH